MLITVLLDFFIRIKIYDILLFYCAENISNGSFKENKETVNTVSQKEKITSNTHKDSNSKLKSLSVSRSLHQTNAQPEKKVFQKERSSTNDVTSKRNKLRANYSEVVDLVADSISNPSSDKEPFESEKQKFFASNGRGEFV